MFSFLFNFFRSTLNQRILAMITSAWSLVLLGGLNTLLDFWVLLTVWSFTLRCDWLVQLDDSLDCSGIYLLVSFKLIFHALVAVLAETSWVVWSVLVGAQWRLDRITIVYVAEMAHEADAMLLTIVTTGIHMHKILQNILVVTNCSLLSS